MRFISQLGLLISGLADSFGWVYLFIASLPFFFLWRMKNRERAWIIGLAAIYLCIGVLLTIIMNTSLDRQNALLCEVFFTASHAVVAIMIGYGLALLAAYMATHYERFRNWGLIGGAIATVLALYCLVSAMGKLYFGPAGEITGVHEFFSGIIRAFDKNQYGSPVFANLILVATPLIFIAALLLYRNRAPVVITLCIFATAPVYSSLSHWYKSEQRNHWFGYWFGHDMFTPPFGIYPEMSRNTILFGGTDPGRFCPTSRTVASRWKTKNLTAATFISSPKTHWQTELILIISGRNTFAASKKTRLFSAGSSNTSQSPLASATPPT